jgi:hypothetical protein
MIKILRIPVVLFFAFFPVILHAQNARQTMRNGQNLADAGNLKEAVTQFTLALEMDSTLSEALFSRGACYQQSGETPAAVRDFRRLMLRPDDPFVRQHFDEIRDRLFELQRETRPPVITVLEPALPPDSVFLLPRNRLTLPLKVRITDHSDLGRITVNNQPVACVKTGDTCTFTTEADLSSADRITITASDVYDNTRKVRFTLQRTETDPPRVSVQEPYASDDGEIFLEAESHTLEVEGTIHDASLIRDIEVDGMPAVFNRNERNPEFLATLDVSDKHSFTVTATDIYGNDTAYTYVLNREAMLLHDVNPMGKTWVVILENTDYQAFPSLDAASPDIPLIRSSLSRYIIHRIIHKKNLTKMETERFFSIELRDLMRNQDVGALLVWFAGHGNTGEEGSYWIPVDARRDDPLTWYNLNALRASMLSYDHTISHFLIVSDACLAGPSICRAEAPDSVIPDCGDAALFKVRSAQSLSIPGADAGGEKSLLARTVAAVLDANTSACLPVDALAEKLNETLKAAGATAEFGVVNGLSHDGGTFFFMTKSEIR